MRLGSDRVVQGRNGLGLSVPSRRDFVDAAKAILQEGIMTCARPDTLGRSDHLTPIRAERVQSDSARW